METKQTVTEWANDHLGLTLAITKRLHEEQTSFQHIEIVETEPVTKGQTATDHPRSRGEHRK